MEAEFSNIQFGNLKLGDVKFTPLDGSSDLLKQILEKMHKEQPQLAESLICWYSPNLQGMTNKQLFDSMLVGEYPILKDLSGNGYDMELHGFDGTSSSGIDGDGNLHFDGINDWGIWVNLTMELDFSQATLFHKSLYLGRNNTYAESFVVGKVTSLPKFNIGGTYAIEAYNAVSDTSYRYGYCGKNTNVKNSPTPNTIQEIELSYISNFPAVNVRYSINGKVTIKSDTLSTSQYANAISSNAFVYATQDEACQRLQEFILSYTIVFNRNLSDNELDWVRNNMLISQEPKKYTINFYHYADGEPILLGTKKVNNGAEIGELPVIEGVGDWYYDLSLDEESLVYEDDYVESDLNLYGN